MGYIQEIDKAREGDPGPGVWCSIRERGDLLLSAAGSVEKAALALWIAREHLGRNNLQGVDSDQLDDLLHPDHLAYLREVRAQGMPARFQGQREGGHEAAPESPGRSGTGLRSVDEGHPEAPSVGGVIGSPGFGAYSFLTFRARPQDATESDFVDRGKAGA